jgi:hypothetical protein
MKQAVEVDVVAWPHTGNHTVFLSGPPGAGKTSVAVRRLLYLLEQGVASEQILVLVPQRTLAAPFYDALHSVSSPAGGVVDVSTVAGLARRTLELFWPLVAEAAGFAHPNQPPRFLTLETAQYYMDRLAEPFIGAGAFAGVTIPRPRLVSQIIDNLNKAAAMDFPPKEIAARLKSAWGGESAWIRIFDQVQDLALAFRRSCLDDNLLDWSLQLEVFWHHLLPLPQFRRYMLSGYRHLIVDNVEEDIPTAHDLLRLWLPLCESALVVYDTEGGYRVFLGADPKGALALADCCRQRVSMAQSRIMSPEVAALGTELVAGIDPDNPRPPVTVNPRPALRFQSQRFHPQMLDWVAGEISGLVLEEGIAAGQIAVLAPFLSDALRFALTERLTRRYNIPVRTHRPSRELREEPAVQSLLTLAKLAHPGWRRPPASADVAQALAQSIADLDPVRARLLTDIVYRVKDGLPTLLPFHQIVSETQERISFLLGGRYDELRQWLQSYVDGEPPSIPPTRGEAEGFVLTRGTEEGSAPTRGEEEGLDQFLSRLFGQVLSQPGFGFHHNLDSGAQAARIIESIQKFRSTFAPAAAAQNGPEQKPDVSLEYIDLVEQGVIAAQYVSAWQIHPQNAVLLVPAYTFLMANEPVDVQFWLDAGSRAWSERIYQPLTHPYVLHRDWPEGHIWADEDEVRVRQESLARLVLGLARRCRQRIYLAYSELNERGYEQQGPLLQAVQRLLRTWKDPVL